MMSISKIYDLRWLLLLLVLPATMVRAQGPGSVPRPPREALAAFALADPALTIELVAAEPEVTSPVAIAWDEDGRLYVAEMTDYPVAPASGRIRRLEDEDGDGRYEHATIFAEGLPFPNGVMPCFGGVLVTAAPNIWFLRDRDGDGRADEKRIVLTGFGEGNTQLRVNGLFWGLDNQIYAANGRSDGEVRAPDPPPGQSVSIRRRDLRFRLKERPGPGQAVRVEAIAGFSQFGLAFDDWGNRFPTWNTIPIRNVVLEQQALDRNPYLAETSSVASILDLADGGRIHGISPAQARFNRESVAYFNASCGPTIERGDWLPAAYHGNAFVCEPLSNLVHRRVLEPAGVTFIARRVESGREFLASSDPAFRPVNLATGPDGALTIVDMYRELVEHPEFVPESARGTVDFRRWHDRGRIWRVRPKSTSAAAVGRRPNLSQAGAPELVALLGHSNGWWRMTAQRLLVERQDRAAVPLLIAALQDTRNPLTRLHALWSLTGLDAVDSAVLSQMIADPHPGLREHALRVASAIESHQHDRLLTTTHLVARAEDPAIRVRLQAALALGDRCREEPAALDALGKIAVRDAADPWMQLAILSGLAEASLSFIPSCDPILSAAGRAQLLARAAEIVGVRRRAPELASLLRMIASRVDQGGAQRSGPGRSIDALTMLAGLAEGLERSGPPLHAVIATPPPELKPDLERLALLWPAARALAISNKLVSERLVALDVVARGRPDLAEEIVPELLAVNQPLAIQAAAARAVARAGRPSLGAKALDHWNDLTLGTRRELLAALAGSPLLAESVLQALERQTIAPTELDAATREALNRLSNPTLRSRASAILARFAPPQRSAALARYQDTLKLGGDGRRGAALFDKHCQTCHQHQGRGHKVGPDLSGIAGRAPEALLVDILDPNREVAPDYVTLTVATRRGQLVSGLLAEESATTLKLRRADAIEETLLRSEIDEVRSSALSLMPEGLEQYLNLQDMADLIAFLRQRGLVPSKS
jgi:putative membrane-bound dehydrogenase-like protein